MRIGKGRRGRGGGRGEESIEELDREIVREEMQIALGKIKNGKAEGEGGVVIEFIKNLPGSWLGEVNKVLNGLLRGEELTKG